MKKLYRIYTFALIILNVEGWGRNLPTTLRQQIDPHKTAEKTPKSYLRRLRRKGGFGVFRNQERRDFMCC